MASTSQAASSRQSALYISAAEDGNGAFKATEKGFQERVAVAGLGSDIGVFESIHAVRAYIEREYPDGLKRLYFRAHGDQVDGRGAVLVLKSDAEGGKISLSASGEQLESIKRICQAVQPGGTLIVEGCYSGLGKDNLLKFLASMCREDVLVVGSKGSAFEVGFDPVLNMHTRFTDVKTHEDLTRIYYTKNGKTQHISVRQFNLLWDCFRSRIDPDDQQTLQRAYRLCYQLLGERNDPQAFMRIREENQEFIATLLEDHEALQKKFTLMPFGKQDAGPVWQAALTGLEGCRNAFEYTGEEEISLAKVSLHLDDLGLHFTRHAHPYEAAYRFLLGCAAVEHYKTLLMLYDNGKTNTLDNPAALLIHALSNLSIHGNGDQSITHTLAKDFPTLKESYLLAKKHEEQEAGLLQEWFTTVIGVGKGACFDRYVERNAFFYFTRLAIETNLGLRVAVQKGDLNAFDRFMANGADLNYRHVDGRTIWDIALQTGSPDMLAKVTLAYPVKQLRKRVQAILATANPPVAITVLGDICEQLSVQGNFDQALEVATATPRSIRKMHVLGSLLSDLDALGDSAQSKRVRLRIFQHLCAYFQDTYGKDIQHLPCTTNQMMQLLKRARKDLHNNVTLLAAVKTNDFKCFDQLIAYGADPDYRHFDGRTIWDAALQESSPAMLARLVFAYPEERFSTLTQTIRTTVDPSRASEVLKAICDRLIPRGKLDQALEVAEAIPEPLQKAQVLTKLLIAWERAGKLEKTEQIRSKIFQMHIVYFQETYAEDIQGIPCTTDQLMQWLERMQDEDHALMAIAQETHLPCLSDLSAGAIRAWLNNPANAEQLSQITALHLDGKNLKLLPAEIDRFTSLRSLFLQNNQLKSLPEQIGNLTLLQWIDLLNNQLTALPPEIGKLSALRMLNLDRNRLQSLPKQISKLTALQSLYLASNQLISISPKIGKLTSLRDFDLSYNQLNHLPEQIGSLTALEWLDVSNNQLTFLCPKIVRLTVLQNFDLVNNPWMFISDVELTNDLELNDVCKQLESFMQYQPQSPLGRLFQLIGTNKDERAAFSALPPELQRRISDLVDQSSSDTPIIGSSSAAASSSEDLIPDTGIFARSVRKTTYDAFNELSPELKERVYEEIGRLAGVDDLQWGKAHAFEHVLRFCDALYKIITVG